MGFHLGSTDTTCDFDGILDGNMIAECEREVNSIIRENHPVYPIFPEPDDPDGDALRTIALGAKMRTDKLCAVFGGEDGNYRFVLCGEGAKEAFDRLKSSLNARGGGKDLICGSISASKMQIEEII